METLRKAAALGFGGLSSCICIVDDMKSVVLYVYDNQVCVYIYSIKLR
jgi:hypothetical protein